MCKQIKYLTQCRTGNPIILGKKLVLVVNEMN